MNKKPLTGQQIKNIVQSLAMSQRFYGRLLHTLGTQPDALKKLVAYCKRNNICDAVDFVMALES